MTARRLPRRSLVGRTATIWKVVACTHCGAVVGVRCALPDGTTMRGSHSVRIKRLWRLRRQRRGPQIDMFPPAEEL